MIVARNWCYLPGGNWPRSWNSSDRGEWLVLSPGVAALLVHCRDAWDGLTVGYRTQW